MRLGKTNLEVNKIGFGALPIQRRNMKDSIEILHRAYESGIDFYDTARFYTDSEEKLGRAFEDVRENIYLVSKTAAETPEDFWGDLETTLKELRTDYLDLYQHHNISFCRSCKLSVLNFHTSINITTFHSVQKRVMNWPMQWLRLKRKD